MLRHIYTLIKAQVEDREVYQHWITQESVFPCITIVEYNGEFEHDPCGSTVRPFIQIDSWSKDFWDAYDTGIILQNHFMNYQDDVLFCWLSKTMNLAEKMEDGSDTPIFRRSLRFRLKLK